MYLKSLYPDILPSPPSLNAYLPLAGRPEQDEWSDYTAHIEVVTGKTISFLELRQRINDVATALAAPISLGGLELQPGGGEIIGVMSDNSSDYVTLSIACLKIAVPYALISCYSTPFELKHALSLARATRLFVAPQYLSRVLPIATEMGLSEDRIYLMNEDDGQRTSVESLIQCIRGKEIPRADTRVVPKDTTAYLVFSSGTSGLPKAVRVTHGNIVYSLKQGMAVLEARAQVSLPPTPRTPDGIPAALAYLPMHHASGLHFSCFRPLLTKSRLVILPRWNTEAVLNAIPKYKITTMSIVPSMIQQILTHPKVDKVDFSSVLSIITGAAYLPREFLFKFVSLCPKEVHFTEGYGMSECTIAALFQPFPGSLNGRFQENLAATGALIPGMEARIVREDGTEADWNEVGELWLRGENVVPGYWNNPTITKESFVDGWLRTGDRFRVDKSQYFYYADRVKDTLKVSGAQVSPVEIEEVLMAHPKKLISDVTVVGVAGGRTTDERIPRAWIVLNEKGKMLGPSLVTQELETWHKTNLSRYKWLRGGIEIIDEIPKSPTGKTLRRLLRDRYEMKISCQSKL